MEVWLEMGIRCGDCEKTWVELYTVNLINALIPGLEGRNIEVLRCDKCGEEFPRSDEYYAEVAFDQHECE